MSWDSRIETIWYYTHFLNSFLIKYWYVSLCDVPEGFYVRPAVLKIWLNLLYVMALHCLWCWWGLKCKNSLNVASRIVHLAVFCNNQRSTWSATGPFSALMPLRCLSLDSLPVFGSSAESASVWGEQTPPIRGKETKLWWYWWPLSSYMKHDGVDWELMCVTMSV